MSTPTPKSVALITQPLTIVTPDGPPPKWERCECGKTLTTSRADAEAKAAHAASHHNRHVPVKFYTCAHGVWHWAERYITVRDCDCGHPAYTDARAASKAADRRNRKTNSRRFTDVSARAYVCHHGGNHVLLYPVGEKLTQCECGAVSYRDAQTATRLLTFLRENFPSLPDKPTDLGDYHAYRCADAGSIHIARASLIPDDIEQIVDGL